MGGGKLSLNFARWGSMFQVEMKVNAKGQQCILDMRNCMVLSGMNSKKIGVR